MFQVISNNKHMNKNQTLALDSSKRMKFIPGQGGWHRDISLL